MHTADEVLTQFTPKQNTYPWKNLKEYSETFMWESLEEIEHTSTDQLPNALFLSFRIRKSGSLPHF